MANIGWIGFDFDGTLATHETNQQELGDPIEATCKLVRRYLTAGYEVRIVTARATHPQWAAEIKQWCLREFGQELEVTDRKDWNMILLYDDRAIAVEPNTGRLAGFRM